MWALAILAVIVLLAVYYLGQTQGYRQARLDMQAVLATEPDWTALTEDEQRVMLGIVEREMREQRAQWNPLAPLPSTKGRDAHGIRT